MASVESSSSSMFTASGRMRKGVSGLASGLDTDELVKGMTTSTRSKIAKQLQDKDRLEWRATSIRGVSTKLIDFQDKYLSYSSKTNLFSENFFEQRTITPVGVNSKYVTVTGNSNGLNDLSIESVTQLAQDAGFTSGTALQDELLTGDIKLGGRSINDLGGEILRLTYGNTTFNVTFPEGFGIDPATGEAMTIVDPPTGAAGEYTYAQVVTDINKILDDIKFKEGGVQHKLSDRIEFKLGTGNEITIEQKVSGDKKGIAISGGTGEVLNILGLDTMDTTQTAPIKGKIDSAKLVRSIDYSDLAGKKMSFSYNGVQKSITFPATLPGSNSNQKLADFLNGEFNRLFGANKVAATVNGDKLSFKTYDGKTSPSVDDNSVFKLVSGDKDTIGFKGVFQTKQGEGNRVNFNNAIKDVNFKTPINGPTPPATTYDIEINGTVLSFKDTDSMADIVQKINDADLGVKVKYMETSNRLSVVATEPGTSGNVSIKDVAGSGNLAEALFGNDPATGGTNLRTVTPAQDAVVSIKYGNGAAQTIIRNTNAFDLDGLHIAVSGKFTTDPVTFNSKVETENVTKAVSEMIDDFNELLKLVNDSVSEKRDRKYAPLTEEQKEGMTDKQIEAWEKKAKAGILFNDTNMRSLSSDLRFALSLGVDGKEDLSAYGIKVSTEYEDNGKLIFDEVAFKKALEERPDDVKNVFTKPIVKPTDGSDPNPFSGGIMARMKSVYDKYAATTGSEKGILIKEAGLENSLTTLSSSIYKQMNDIDEIVARLKKQLVKEEDRYYRQFTKLEQEVAKMNSQGSWLTQQTQ